jgi:hypothetical protein
MAGGADDPAAATNKIPAIAMLPDGSELKGVMLPRYDENHNLIGVLKSEKITLVSAGQLAGTSISIELFNANQTPRGRIDLVKATYHQEKGLVASTDPVEIKSDRMTASGSGLYYFFDQGQGFLLGPATTTILPAPTETSMNAPTSPLRATALLGMALVSAPVHANPKPEITAEEKAAVHADAVSRAAAAREAGTAARESLQADLADAETASKAAATFLVQADLPPVSTDIQPATKPLDVKPEPTDTVIHCEGGMYFDPDEGVLVYLKNVTVKDPRFNLSGANELKVFFGKKPPKEEDEKDKAATDDTKDKKTDGKSSQSDLGLGVGAKFGDVERIVATGAVLLDQKPAKEGDEPIQASGAIFSYNIKADQVIISGGYPWVVKGKQWLRAKEPNLNLRISPKAGSFVTEGDWETIFNLEQKK